jgi:hypothetical protein
LTNPNRHDILSATSICASVGVAEKIVAGGLWLAKTCNPDIKTPYMQVSFCKRVKVKNRNFSNAKTVKLLYLGFLDCLQSGKILISIEI